MKHRFLILLIIVILCSRLVDVSYAGWGEDREGLDSLHIVNEFRIFYDQKGLHKLPMKYQKDKNGNNVPDYVEDVGIQLASASFIFCDILGFTHPLKSQRYISQNVRFIDVHVLSSQRGGSAGDRIHKFNYSAFENEHGTLSIALSNDLTPHSLTPMHEMFHLILNGSTMFKTRWLTEGTSRWAESVFRKGTGSTQQLPPTVELLDRMVLNQTYKASYFWRRMGSLCDKGGGNYTVPGGMTNEYVDREKILEDNSIHGVNFFVTLLENLGTADKKRSLEKNFEVFHWSEKEQKSSSNDPYILCAIKQTAFQECENMTHELTGFLNVIDTYTKNACYY